MKEVISSLSSFAKKRGAKHVKLIPAQSVVTAEWVRLKCQYGCGGYGARLTCPPHSPTPQQTRLLLDGFEHALLVHHADGAALHDLMPDMEREAFLAGFYKAFAMGAGPCRHCDECNLNECVHPRKARPSMEACGIDVYATARAHGLPIEVVTSRSQCANYYGLLLLE